MAQICVDMDDFFEHDHVLRLMLHAAVSRTPLDSCTCNMPSLSLFQAMPSQGPPRLSSCINTLVFEVE